MVVFDIFVCLFFIGFIEWALKLIDKEELDQKKFTVLITDFAVRIGNLPDKATFGTHAALEAKLVHHIDTIVNHELQKQ